MRRLWVERAGNCAKNVNPAGGALAHFPQYTGRSGGCRAGCCPTTGAVVARLHLVAAAPLAPGPRPVLRVVVERPLALVEGADLQPSPAVVGRGCGDGDEQQGQRAAYAGVDRPE